MNEQVICMWCGDRIHYERSWPSGRMMWKAPHPVFGSWAFCPEVEGRQHQPFTVADADFLSEIGVSL